MPRKQRSLRTKFWIGVVGFGTLHAKDNGRSGTLRLINNGRHTADVSIMTELKQKALAFEIASKLYDTQSIGLHEYFVRRCPERFLREQLEYVLSLPEKSITTTRARYYTHLVKKLGGEYLYDARN